MSQNQAPAAPDVSQLGQQTLPESAFPAGRDQPFRVWFRPEAHHAVWKHANETPGVEICGVLVGKWAKDADGPYLSATEIIRGDAATSKFAEVTFTHETWGKINHEMDTRFTGLSIVGWYHSHPDFGIFLSDRDRFIQENFFSGAGQIALVVDPVRKTEGVFVWQKGKPALTPHCWVGDSIRSATAAGSEAPAHPSAVTTVPGGGAAPAQGPVGDDLPAWLPLLGRGVMFLGVFLVGYLLAGCGQRRVTDFEKVRIAQGAEARALVFYKIRPGLGRELDEVSEDLGNALKQAKKLATDHIKAAEDEDEVKEAWGAVLDKLTRSTRQVRTARLVYAPTPEELRELGLADLSDPAPAKKKDEKSPAAKDKKDVDKDGGKTKDRDSKTK